MVLYTFYVAYQTCDEVVCWRLMLGCSLLRKKLQKTGDSWQIDETYVKVKGKWQKIEVAPKRRRR